MPYQAVRHIGNERTSSNFAPIINEERIINYLGNNMYNSDVIKSLFCVRAIVKVRFDNVACVKKREGLRRTHSVVAVSIGLLFPYKCVSSLAYRKI